MKDYCSIISLQSNMSQIKHGFKLQSDSEKDEERSVAASSIHYKQRIDSMFDDTRSVVSGVSISKNNYNNNTQYFRYNQAEGKNSIFHKAHVTNEVQNRINKMFQEMDSSDVSTSVEAVKFQKFPVAYMGSIALREKVTSLRELQLPLKELYFNYIRNGRTSCLVHGSLEITQAGLKIKNYGNNFNKASERMYSFSMIAVWAAVKFVFRNKEQYAVMNRGGEQTEFAFMPLIADPESVDKISLYQNLSQHESDLLMEGDNTDNPPLFIVVMRESGSVNNFDCHGFICSSSNDAIILAANLYTALVQAIPSAPLNNNTNNYSEPRDKLNMYPPRSLKYSGSHHGSCTGSSVSASHLRNCREFPKAEVPKKPPRKQKPVTNSGSCTNLSSEDITKMRSPWQKHELVGKHAMSLDDINNIKSTAPSADIYFENNKSLGSLVSRSSKQLQAVKNESDAGDILTKVAIPRSKSFLNASGPFSSRYTKSVQGLVETNSYAQKKSNVVSPLGLNELFQEFKQEGLYSMNDILDAIIDPDGMSFNDLKPIYKEFVLKLALTLTKDELYQRSKSIMQKQKNKKRQLDRRDNIKKSFMSGNVLKKALRRSVTNLKYSKYKQNSLEFTSVLFSSSSEYVRKRSSSNSDKHLSISAVSSVSSRDKRPVRKQRSNTSSSQSKDASGRSKNSKTSEYINEKRRDSRGSGRDREGKKNYVHNSSSGYISCSECSYSSDSCTCSSTEKCYCSLGNKRLPKCGIVSKHTDVPPCDCDTDSCFESDKCYCNQSSFESCSDKSIKSNGDNVTLVTPHSNRTGERVNVFRNIEGAVSKTEEIKAEIEVVRGHKPSWPIEPQVNCRKTVGESKGRNNASIPDVTYGSRRSGGQSERSKFSRSSIPDELRSEKKVLVVSARDPSGKVVYMGQTRAKSMPQDLDAISSTDDALCVKKTAEIAALFSTSNDNIIYNTLEPPENSNEKYFKSSYVETNLESSLGYLP